MNSVEKIKAVLAVLGAEKQLMESAPGLQERGTFITVEALDGQPDVYGVHLDREGNGYETSCFGVAASEAGLPVPELAAIVRQRLGRAMESFRPTRLYEEDRKSAEIIVSDCVSGAQP